MLDFQIKHYNELLINEFHDIMALRVAIFVVEQNCPYLELDGKDKKSYHLIARNGEGNVVGTARILPIGVSYKEVSIGRFCLDQTERSKNEGHKMMNLCMQFIREEFGNVPVRISAQKYLEKFYIAHGFNSTGNEYPEDGIPHVEMLFTA